MAAPAKPAAPSIAAKLLKSEEPKSSVDGTKAELDDTKEYVPPQYGCRNALTFILQSAYRDLYKSTIWACFSYANGWWFHDEKHPMKDEDVEALGAQMKKLLASSPIIVEKTMKRADVITELEARGDAQDKLGLLKLWRVDPVPILSLGHHWDYQIRDITTDTAHLVGHYSLEALEGGVLLRFPLPKENCFLKSKKQAAPTDAIEKVQMPHFFSVLLDRRRFCSALGVESVAGLNKATFAKEIDELLWVSEAKMEKEFAILAGLLVAQYPHKRILFLAGPSSSGKTTSAHRLNVSLRVLGFKSLYMGMDDYYRNQEDIPRTAQGIVDYDILDALDYQLLKDRLHQLLRGDAIPEHHYNFRTHKGYDDPKRTIKMEANQIVIVEGIHALNPAVCDEFDCFKLFLSCATVLSLDSGHHMSTADNRLLRRMLRDYRTRGYGAEETLTRWPLVRLSEEMHIFPYQERADYFLNTSLIYELSILANYCKPLLAEVSAPELQKEASRLLTLLSFFYPMTGDMVPAYSILREFLGPSPWGVLQRREPQ